MLAATEAPTRPRAERRDRPPGRWPLAAVILLGLVGELVYVFALVRPYWLPGHVDRPLLDLGKVGGYDPGDGVRYTAPLALLWVLYLAAGALARRLDRSLLPLALGGALIYSLTLLWLYPITAADIFNYLLYGLSEHRGANPLVQPPSSAIGEPLIGYSAWPGHPSPYGPFWQRLAYLVTVATGESLLAGILGFKLLLITCHLLNTALVARLAGSVGVVRPGVAALLYGWNPLLLYETAGIGHNDIVMLTSALLAAWALTCGGAERSLALPAALLGALVKYVAALWLPLVAFAAWRREAHAGRWRALARVLASATLAGLLAAVLVWPYWAGRQTLSGVERQADLYTTSPASVTMVILHERGNLVERGVLLDTLKGVALAGIGLTSLVALWRLARRPPDAAVGALLIGLFDVSLAYVLLGALWFQPWYLVPLVGLAPLLDGRRRLLALLFALGGFGSYVVYFYAWPALDWTGDRLLIQGLAAGVAHGPVLLGLLGLLGLAVYRAVVGRGVRREA